MNMNTAASLTRNHPVHVVDVTIRDINVLERAFFLIGNDMDAKQVTLVLIRAIGVGDFQTANFPERRVLQENSGGLLTHHIDPGLLAFSDSADANRSSLFAVTLGREHPLKSLSFVKENVVARGKGSSF